MPGRILIADDHPVVRSALRLVVAEKWSEIAVDEVGSIAEIEDSPRTGPYRLAILDLGLPDAHGFSGLIYLKKRWGSTPVVIISSRHDPQTIATAHILGAAGFISKSMSLPAMGAALERAMAGESSFPQPEATNPRAAAPVDIVEASRRVASLSAAQMRVLTALVDGRLNKQIAQDMHLTEATVKAHLTAVFRKLSVHNRTQALLAARPLLESRG